MSETPRLKSLSSVLLATAEDCSKEIARDDAVERFSSVFERVTFSSKLLVKLSILTSSAVLDASTSTITSTGISTT